MTQNDISKLSYAELRQLSKQLDEQIAAKRGEELKVLADGYAKKISAAGFSVKEAIQALQPYLQNSGRGPKKSSAPAPVVYKDPANPNNTWSGRGRAAKWLVAYEAAGRSRNEFKVQH